MLQLTAHAIDRVRIHRVWTDEVDGRTRFLKHRRLGMGPIIAFGNIFLHLSQSRIVMFPSLDRWRTWELHCFELLHGDNFGCGRHARRAIWTHRVPGTSLLTHIERGSATSDMFRSAGSALAKAHHLHSPVFDGLWSHGDPHLANVLVDDAGAYLIDFETMHLPQLTAEERHADDLLVLVLDTLGRVSGERMVDLCGALLEGYDAADMQERLRKRLVMPSGFERILWHTRTAFIKKQLLQQRLQALRDALA